MDDRRILFEKKELLRSILVPTLGEGGVLHRCQGQTVVGHKWRRVQVVTRLYIAADNEGARELTLHIDHVLPDLTDIWISFQAKSGWGVAVVSAELSGTMEDAIMQRLLASDTDGVLNVPGSVSEEQVTVLVERLARALVQSAT